jgi:hypothetical protein
VDGLVWIAGFVPQLSGFALKLTTQRGYLQGYALTMILGIAVILLIVFCNDVARASRPCRAIRHGLDARATQ